MKHTKVKEIMAANPVIISPDSTIKEAAKRMEVVGCGILPVGTEEMLEGIITDRDIVVRAVARGKDTNMELVRDYMTPGVCYCREDDTLEEAARLMRQNQVNRLVVRDAQGKFSGIITFGHFIRKDDNLEEIGEVIENAVGKKRAA